MVVLLPQTGMGYIGGDLDLILVVVLPRQYNEMKGARG